MADLNINIFQSGEKTAQLRCNWCGEPHQVEPEYRERILERSRVAVAEYNHQNGTNIQVEDGWTCGLCMLALAGLPADALKTECHPHEVPQERKGGTSL